MKAICITACEVDGFGIVTPGEEIELADGYAKDFRIRTHFVIDEASVKNPDAPVPDFEKEADARLEAFKRSLVNETEWMKAINRLIDDGATIPAEVSDKTDPKYTDEQRIAKLAELWCDSFGWKFPTDKEEPAAKGGQQREAEGDAKGKEKPKKTKPEKEELFDR